MGRLKGEQRVLFVWLSLVFFVIASGSSLVTCQSFAEETEQPAATDSEPAEPPNVSEPDPSTRATASGRGPLLRVVLSEQSESKDDDTSRFTPRALQLLEAAKARLETEQRAKAQAEQARRREQAQQFAIQTAREKAKDLAVREREAQRQLRLARERRLKFLYYKALALYRQGSYKQAIDTLQQMGLVDPSHPMAKAADRLMAKAELKRFEQQARTRAALPSATGEARIPELERLLAQKRIELETVIKYAKSALRDRNYDAAIELLHRVLNQDPLDREAQQLLEQAQTAKLKEEEMRLGRQTLVDEREMMNQVARAETLPPDPLGVRPAPRPTRTSTQTSSALLMSKLKEPISFDFQDVSFSDVLDFLTDAANISIIPSPSLDLQQYRVSLKVDQLPLELALKYLVKNLGLSYRVDDMAILIASAEEFTQGPMETRVFFLRSGISPFALETSAVTPNPVLGMESLKALVEQAVPQPSGSKLVLDERSGSMVITNTSENLRLVERVLSQLDVTPVQVLIETRFLELTLTDLEHLGFESVLTGDVELTKKTDPKDLRGPGHQLAKSGGFKFPSLSRESEGLNLTLQGVLTGTQFETVLHLLEETKKSKTLSAPRVTALNNQTATIKVVDEFRYPTRYEVSLIQFDINGDGDFDDAGETEFANVPQDLQKRDIGILLHVTPSVGKDLNMITLVLVPEVSQFSQFRDLGGGVTVPEFTSSQLTTSVVIEDGQTVVLGGLMKDTVSEQLTKVPVLGDIPLLGHLFRQREESQTRKNLLIFVTARILAPRGPTT